jgi:uncharacterized Zn finger protein
MASRSYTVPSKTGKGRASKDIQEGASPAYMAQVLGIKRVKSTTPVSPVVQLQGAIMADISQTISQFMKKRKVTEVAQDYDEEDEFAAAQAQDALAGIQSKPKRAKLQKNKEKRLRVFRKKAPQSYLERLDRVRSQRMFLIDRNRNLSADGTHEEEVFDIAGTTGNIYQVTITKQPHCTCPDSGKGNQCKHIIYVSSQSCGSIE